MHLFGTRVLKQNGNAQHGGRQSARQLRAVAAAMLTLSACMPSGFAQQQAGDVLGAGEKHPESAASALPSAPAPVMTQPLNLRQTERDFSKPAARGFGSPINWYRPTTLEQASFANSVRLINLVKDGKIYLSLSDAIALAIENNYDIAISRYDLDIADTDILRAKSGYALLGAPSGLITGTLGGAPTTLTTGGGPGGTTVGSGGAGSGVSGLTLTTNGAGPAPVLIDPTITGALQWDRNRTQFTGPFSPAAATNTNTYNFTYNEGFIPGTLLTVSWNNNRVTSSSPFAAYLPNYNSVFKATVTQHLLQGAGFWVNKRFLYQARNDRRITNSAFRQQILYTVNQVEQIYWGLVQSYEDVQAKEQALEQSTKLDSDTRKQLEIGTMAPLDVVNADSTVATDKQALISSQSVLAYQQLIMKQAIARNLNDPVLEKAPVVPTDRVSLEEIPEERQSTEDLVQTAFKNRPELEQAVLTLRNDEITLKGARNALLPVLDAFGYYGSTITGGPLNPNCSFFGNPCAPAGAVPETVPGVFSDLVNSTAPDKGIGINLTITLRNREAQSQQARSLMEYRQAELRLEQLYTQIRMQVVNAQAALTNDRALVQADEAAVKYNRQSLDAEEKKLKLGASTTANVLLQERNLATAEDNLIDAHGAYANARAALYQITATTLQHYGINLEDAAKGVVSTDPVVPGLKPAPKGDEPSTIPPATR